MALTRDERATISAAIELIASRGVTVKDHPDIPGEVIVTNLIIKRTHDEGELKVAMLVAGLLTAINLALEFYAAHVGITTEDARAELLGSLRHMLAEEELC